MDKSSKLMLIGVVLLLAGGLSLFVGVAVWGFTLDVARILPSLIILAAGLIVFCSSIPQSRPDTRQEEVDYKSLFWVLTIFVVTAVAFIIVVYLMWAGRNFG